MTGLAAVPQVQSNGHEVRNGFQRSSWALEGHGTGCASHGHVNHLKNMADEN